MTTFSTAELAKLIAENPDIHLEDPGALNALRSRRAPAQTERDMQAAVFAEADLRALVDPRWGLLLAIPNGQYRQGQRPEPGLKAGVPDIFLAVPNASKGFHGAFIELKVKHNRPTVKQRSWLAELSRQGYFCTVVYDNPAEVIDLIDWYLEDTP